jgi:hypothetical protein
MMTKITKAQLKALEFAGGHIAAGNAPAFIRTVESIIRAASSQKQADAVKSLAKAMLRGETV